MAIHVTALKVHPVKSLRGFSVPSTRFTPEGLAWDRAWLLIDSQGQFLSQRRHPRMATVETAVTEEALVLTREGHGACSVPLAPLDGERRVTEVWGDRCEVVDQGDPVSSWLGSALELDTAPRLVRMAPGYRRPGKRPERYGEATPLFADTAPLLVANEASLDALNSALVEGGQAPVPMSRFRANIVLSGLEAFGEHELQALRGPGYRLGLRYPRERCVVTTIDQRTGHKDPSGEPFRTLRRLNPMPGGDRRSGPAFAELAVLEAGNGATISVGDALEPVWPS